LSGSLHGVAVEAVSQGADERSKAVSLATPHEDALALADENSFLQQVAKKLRQHTVVSHQEATMRDVAIQQLTSRSIVADEVLDLFAETGAEKSDIPILSECFLAEVVEMPQKNLALEALHKLLNDEVRQRGMRRRRNSPKCCRRPSIAVRTARSTPPRRCRG
jgi:type I restriction enzyme, R subunit